MLTKNNLKKRLHIPSMNVMNYLEFVGVEYEIGSTTWMNSTSKVEINNDLIMSSIESNVGTPNVAMTYNVLCHASRKCTYLKENYYKRLSMSFPSSI